MSHATAVAGVGTVEIADGVLIVTADGRMPSCGRIEFARFVDTAERAYLAQTSEFGLVFDLSALERAAPALWQCIEWMRLFQRVRPHTETTLRASAVSASSPMVLAGVALFRTMHSPVKPMTTHTLRSDAVAAVRASNQQRANLSAMASRGHAARSKRIVDGDRPAEMSDAGEFPRKHRVPAGQGRSQR